MHPYTPSPCVEECRSWYTAELTKIMLGRRAVASLQSNAAVVHLAARRRPVGESPRRTRAGPGRLDQAVGARNRTTGVGVPGTPGGESRRASVESGWDFHAGIKEAQWASSSPRSTS